jgi:tetratricopeptide (TPR) repeat protein
MKSLTLAALGAGVLVGVTYWLKQAPASPDTPREIVVETVSPPTPEAPVRTEPIMPVHDQSNPAASAIAQDPSQARPSRDLTKAQLDAALINQTVDILVSPQIGYGQRQAAWKHLLDNGKIDQAISALEQRMAANPQVAEYPSALAQAYFKKCSTLKDVREQGILAMQADKLFDVALDLDPTAWEARFNKAVGLSYWPASMNKGEEVLQHFTALIGQQETQAPQPHFADTYVLLGNQYEKSGRNDYARMVWERGASLFPNDDRLRQKLAVGLAAQGK